jgi:hypothetical protein
MIRIEGIPVVAARLAATPKSRIRSENLTHICQQPMRGATVEHSGNLQYLADHVLNAVSGYVINPALGNLEHSVGSTSEGEPAR